MPYNHSGCEPVKCPSPDESDAQMLDQAPAGFLRAPALGEPAEAVAVAVNRFASTGRIVRIPLLAWSEAAELFGLSEHEARQALRHFRHLAAVPS
jgi:hypothetical protein